MTRKLLPLVLLMIAALGAIAWWAARGRSARGLERADNSTSALQSEAQPQLSGESQSLEARSVEKTDVETQSTSGSSQSTGSGTLRLRVLDETTRAPIPDLQFVAYRERGGEKDLARGKTDKEGRAALPGIEANTVIVRTERKPPHAEAYGAVWLTVGATKELELLVGVGGAVTGRVVDDLEHPVGGAEIRVGELLEREKLQVRSAADGRFRIEFLAARPRSVWIVDGAMRPEYWNELWLFATLGEVNSTTKAMPLAGKDVDVGDMHIPRATTYVGRLLDASERPVGGALLSTRGKHSHGPAEPEFELQPGEVLTDGAGRFEIRGHPGPTEVLVWARSGQSGWLPLPAAKPGERVEGLELHLWPETAFELELVDAGGAPAEIPAPTKTPGGGPIPGRDLQSYGVVTVLARSADGARERADCEHPDSDGKWRGRLPIDPGEIGELEIKAPGYAAILERSVSGFPAFVQRKLALTPYPTFRVRLVPKDPGAKLREGEGESVVLSICMADPARHAQAQGHCCGLGARWSGFWRGGAQELVLPVRRQAPFWIYALGPRPGESGGAMHSMGYAGEPPGSGGLCDLAHIGPFEPGPDVREFALDPADFVRPKIGEQTRKPPEPSASGEKHFARLRAHVDDARTGKPIPGAWVSIGGADANADENGDLKCDRVPPGRWKIQVVGRGYRSLDLGERTTREGETLELGSLALEPRVRHRGRILDADGNALPRVWLGIVAGRTAADEENGGLTSAPDGSFELLGELPASFVLQAVAPALHAGWGAQVQRFALEPWPKESVKELRFAVFRKVLVTLAGVDPEEATLVPLACVAPGEPTATCDHRLALMPAHQQFARGLEIASSEAGPRFAFLLAPGRYVFWGSSLMHELPWTELEVAAGDTDIELTITAH